MRRWTCVSINPRHRPCLLLLWVRGQLVSGFCVWVLTFIPLKHPSGAVWGCGRLHTSATSVGDSSDGPSCGVLLCWDLHPPAVLLSSHGWPWWCSDVVTHAMKRSEQDTFCCVVVGQSSCEFDIEFEQDKMVKKCSSDPGSTLKSSDFWILTQPSL